MNLNINSPAYYTKVFGVDEEIYRICYELGLYVKNRRYSEIIDTIGIVPIIAPDEEIERGLWKEIKRCEAKYRFASVSLQINYDQFVNAENSRKKQLIIENILKSVKVIEKKGKINYSLFENDVKMFCKENDIEI